MKSLALMRGYVSKLLTYLVVMAFAFVGFVAFSPAANAAPVLSTTFANSYLLSPTDAMSVADVEQSIVHLDVAYSAYVQYEYTKDGVDYTKWSEDPTTVYYGCTGFFVTSIYIVTAGHCVDPADSGIAYDIVDEFLLDAMEAAGEKLPDNVIENARNTWAIAGDNDHDDPLVKVTVLAQPGGVVGAVVTRDTVAQVVDFKRFEDGDVALLKVADTGAKGMVIAAATPKQSEPINSIGFPSSIGQSQDYKSVRASFKTGTVSSSQTSDNGVAGIEVSTDMDYGMSGGPTVNAQNEVVGVNSYMLTNAKTNFNFITDTVDLRTFLTRNGVTMAAPAVVVRPSDSTGSDKPRALASPAASSGMPSWLWLVIGIGVVALILIGAFVFLYMRQNKKTSKPTPSHSAKRPATTGSADADASQETERSEE